MNPVVILLPAFLISLVALAVFIWSMHRGVFGHDAAGARVIFTAHEVGHTRRWACSIKMHRNSFA